jgi:hypothetical protein
MNDFEPLRVIEYLERTRRPYRALFPMAEENPVLVHLCQKPFARRSRRHFNPKPSS